ncbi:protein rep [Aeromonas media]|uniref:protein rep n=1 Tax=Aeromonas media TaxID=651 RepID=UPI00370CE93C
MIITDATSGCNDSGAVAPRGAPSGVRADSGPLGNIAKTYSPQSQRGSQAGDFDPETGEVTEPNPQLARANRWALKSVVNKLLPDSRTSKCMVLRAPVAGQILGDIQIMKGIHKKAFYQGLLVCSRVWTCPVCAAKIAERRRQELKEAIAAAIAQGMRVHFVTLTVPHYQGDDIKSLNDRLSKALKRLSQGKYSVKNQLKAIAPENEIHGYIRAFEVTHNVNGFNPHFHILVFTDRGVTSNAVGYVYRNAWIRACKLSDLPEPSLENGCTVQDGSEAAKYASKWGLEDEMTKGHTKKTRRKGATPWGLLRAVLDGDDPEYPPERAGKLFQVYAKAFHGRRQLYWSNGLRALLELSKELTDEELAAKAEDERASVLATITVAQWRAIRRFHQEAHLLTVAEDAPALLAITIERLVFKDAAAPPG